MIDHVYYKNKDKELDLMKAALYKNSRVVEVEEIKKPEIKDNEALTKIKYTGICGTDIHIHEGLHPRTKSPTCYGS